MIGWPYRPEERRPAVTALRTRGVRILYAGQRWFVPGGSYAIAMGLARAAGLVRPGADIEFGEVLDGDGWVALGEKP